MNAWTAVKPLAAFAAVDAWVFDLDNTLYAADCGVFPQIHARMAQFIRETLDLDADAADALRARYWRDHGTTLNGLMREQGLAPELFLDFVHDIDLSAIPPSPALAAAISGLPGRKLVHTNGSRDHAARVLAQLGLEGRFDGVYAIEDSDFTPKPERAAFEQIAEQAGIDPGRSAMFEDSPRNLHAPKEMGMVTILVRAPAGSDAALTREPDGAEDPKVDFVTEDLTDFVTQVARSIS